MDRYFFDVHQGGDIEEDVEGHELPDLASVKRDAVASAREIMADDIRRGILPDERSFHVRNSRGETVLTMAFAEALSQRS